MYASNIQEIFQMTKWMFLRLIFVRRYPDLGGRFLCTAGNCKIAAEINEHTSAKHIGGKLYP